MHHTCASAQSLSGVDGNGPHSVHNTWSLVAGTVEGFKGMALLEECGVGFEVSHCTLSSVCEVSAAVPASCLLACHHAPATMVIESISLELPAPNKLSHAWDALVKAFYHTNSN